MTILLSMSSLTGTDRTLVAVGTSRLAAMLVTVRAAAPRSARCSDWSEISGWTGFGGSLVTGRVVGSAASPPEPLAATVAPSASARGAGCCLARWLSVRCSAGEAVRGGLLDPARRSLRCFSSRSTFPARFGARLLLRRCGRFRLGLGLRSAVAGLLRLPVPESSSARWRKKSSHAFSTDEGSLR